MNITVISVGKLKEKYLKLAIDEYAKRLGRYCKLDIIELPDEKTPDNASEKEELIINYEPSVDDIFFEDELISKREKDLRFAQTSVGPHRDDISFTINGIDMRKFGSQGQQRCCALSLKLSEIDIVSNIIKDKPVLLLDDVLSELDSSRQKLLLDSLSNIQTIITCTGLDDFVNNRFDANRIFNVVNGTINQV